MPAWNLLSGFPGEDPAEYTRTAELLPLLTHLQPPTSCPPIRLDRFSPFFSQTDRFGLQRLRPAPAYYYVYPFGRRELARLAYFFDFDYPDERRPFDYTRVVKQAIDDWYTVRNPSLTPDQYARLDATLVDDGDLLIADTRPCAPVPSRLVTGTPAHALLRCDTSQTAAGLARQMKTSEEEIRVALDSLRASKLVVEMEDHYTSLPVLRNRPALRHTGESHAHAYIPETAAAQPLLRII